MRKTPHSFIAPTILFICSALFFSLIYPSHIRFQEQYQLFEFTGDYFTSVTSIPGGFADWCGRFLIQFFLFPWAGGIIIGALLILSWWLTTGTSDHNSPAEWLIALIPPAFLFSMFLCDDSLTGAATAVLLSHAAASALGKMNPGPLRTVIILTAAPLLYFLCGPAAIIFSALLPLNERSATKAAAAVLITVCPLFFQFAVHYPLSRLYTGLHYIRIPSEFPTAVWMVVLSIIAARSISRFPAQKKAPAFISGAIVLLLGIALTVSNADMDRERTMAYDTMVMDGQWDDIILDARKNLPENTLTVSCLNLALAQKGLLPESQFAFFQAGEKGLFPSYSISYRSLPCISEIYWHLGMVNACQQYIFDAQEAIPDFQKSGRCYKRIAETNLINGDLTVARKYIEALGHTLFYRKWASETGRLLESPDDIDTHPTYGKLRSLRPCDTDALFNENSKYAMCLGLLEHNPDNIMAEQYLFSLLLLEKDLDGFRKMFRPGKYTAIPKHYQEAVALICINERQPLESLSGMVSEKNIRRMGSFITDMKTRTPESAMQKRYGDTYWYYSIFK